MLAFGVPTFLSGRPYHLSNPETSIRARFGVLAALCLLPPPPNPEGEPFVLVFGVPTFLWPPLPSLQPRNEHSFSFRGSGCPLLATTSQLRRRALRARFQGSDCSLVASQPQNSHSSSFWGSDCTLLARLTTIRPVLAKPSPTAIVFAWRTTLVLAKMWPTTITFAWPTTLYPILAKK